MSTITYEDRSAMLNSPRRMKPLKENPSEKWRDRRIADAVDAYYDGAVDEDGNLDVERVRRIGRSLHDIRVRDVLLWELSRLPEEGCVEVASMGRVIAMFMHHDDSLPVLTVSAIGSWLAGDESVALETLAKAADVPGSSSYNLLLLVAASIATGMDPDNWRDGMHDMDRDTARYGKGGK